MTKKILYSVIKMKIAHYINNLGSGGAEKLLVDYLPLMVKEGHQVDLIVSNHDKSILEYINQLKEGGIKIHNLNCSFYSFKQIYQIIKLINKNKYDIVHAHLFPSQYWLAFASFFIKSKTTLIKTEHSSYNERRKLKLFRILEKLIYSRYKSIIGITDIVSYNLRDWINDNSKIVTINNGLNLSNDNSLNNNFPEFLEKDYYNILMVGRLSVVHKDHENLIRSLLLLNCDYHLFLAGQGPDEEYLKNLVNSLNLNDRVHFLGMRIDVRFLMEVVDLNILCSKVEGLSGVTLESLFSGKPFLGSNISGICDVVPNQEFLFENNPKEISEKIKKARFDEDFKSYLIKEGVNHATKYDIKNMTRKYLDLYKRVILNNER